MSVLLRLLKDLNKQGVVIFLNFSYSPLPPPPPIYESCMSCYLTYSLETQRKEYCVNGLTLMPDR